MQNPASAYPEGVVLEDIPCPLDGSTESTLVIEAHDILYHVRGEFRVVKCTACGLMRTSPRPTLETMGVYYPDSYTPYVATRARTGGSALRRLARRVLDTHAQKTPDLPAGRLLEIGCASGSYLQTMAEKGWQVAGIEPNAQAAEAARARGFEVFTGAVEAAPDQPAVHDLIVGWMVLEHLHDPIGALQRLRDWTKPDGWAVFSVPNAAALEFRLFGRSWYALQVPTHTFHYTPQTIARVLERGGWRLEKVYHQRTVANLMISAGHWMKQRGWDNRLARLLMNYNRIRMASAVMFPLAFVLALFGQTGRMTVWARRIDG